VTSRGASSSSSGPGGNGKNAERCAAVNDGYGVAGGLFRHGSAASAAAVLVSALAGAVAAFAVAGAAAAGVAAVVGAPAIGVAAVAPPVAGFAVALVAGFGAPAGVAVGALAAIVALVVGGALAAFGALVDVAVGALAAFGALVGGALAAFGALVDVAVAGFGALGAVVARDAPALVCDVALVDVVLDAGALLATRRSGAPPGFVTADHGSTFVGAVSAVGSNTSVRVDQPSGSAVCALDPSRRGSTRLAIGASAVGITNTPDAVAACSDVWIGSGVGCPRRLLARSASAAFAFRSMITDGSRCSPSTPPKSSKCCAGGGGNVSGSAACCGLAAAAVLGDVFAGATGAPVDAVAELTAGFAGFGRSLDAVVAFATLADAVLGAPVDVADFTGFN
jgi:hypothetical protein